MKAESKLLVEKFMNYIYSPKYEQLPKKDDTPPVPH